MEKVPVLPARSVLGPVMLAPTFGAWFTFWTVMLTVPDTLPPWPSVTVTRRVYVPLAVTFGAVQVGVAELVLLKVPTGEAGDVWLHAVGERIAIRRRRP